MALSSYLDLSPQLSTRVFVHDSAQVIGDVTLGEDVSVWCNAVLRGDVHKIVIGKGTNFQDLAMGHVTQLSFCATRRSTTSRQKTTMQDSPTRKPAISRHLAGV